MNRIFSHAALPYSTKQVQRNSALPPALRAMRQNVRAGREMSTAVQAYTQRQHNLQRNTCAGSHYHVTAGAAGYRHCPSRTRGINSKSQHYCKYIQSCVLQYIHAETNTSEWESCLYKCGVSPIIYFQTKQSRRDTDKKRRGSVHQNHPRRQRLHQKSIQLYKMWLESPSDGTEKLMANMKPNDQGTNKFNIQHTCLGDREYILEDVCHPMSERCRELV